MLGRVFLSSCAFSMSCYTSPSPYGMLGNGNYEDAQNCDEVVRFRASSHVLHRSSTTFTNVM
jgi:hypothetical protein